MSWEIQLTDEMVTFYEGLTERQRDALEQRIDLLEQDGPTLRHPRGGQALPRVPRRIARGGTDLMAGRTPWREIKSKADGEPGIEERRAQAKLELDEQIAAHERGLSELRRARALTQVQLAKSLDVSQAQVSRVEGQTDLYLSTLASYIEAMGGELQLLARFNDELVPLRIGELELAQP